MTHHQLRLYDYAASCNGYKVRLLLAHLHIAYERVPVDIFNGDTLSNDYAHINPMRTTPVLKADGRHLPESNAILFSWRTAPSPCPATYSSWRRWWAG